MNDERHLGIHTNQNTKATRKDRRENTEATLNSYIQAISPSRTTSLRRIAATLGTTLTSIRLSTRRSRLHNVIPTETLHPILGRSKFESSLQTGPHATLRRHTAATRRQVPPQHPIRRVNIAPCSAVRSRRLLRQTQSPSTPAALRRITRTRSGTVALRDQSPRCTVVRIRVSAEAFVPILHTRKPVRGTQRIANPGSHVSSDVTRPSQRPSTPSRSFRNTPPAAKRRNRDFTSRRRSRSRGGRRSCATPEEYANPPSSTAHLVRVASTRLITISRITRNDTTPHLRATEALSPILNTSKRIPARRTRR